MPLKLRWIVPFCVAALAACGGSAGNHSPADTRLPGGKARTEENRETYVFAERQTAPRPSVRKLEEAGYVNITAADPTVAVEIVYATPDNFVGETLYDDLTEAYLLPEAARRVAEAHRMLKERHPSYRFIIYDAARPMSVQRRMWEVAVRTGKTYYVANPAKGGGLHNYGAAVDLSILDGEGKPLPMGTGYDHLGPLANTDREEELVRGGQLTAQERANRLLLREVMTRAGFRTVKSEWWHFNLCSREEAVKTYPLIDF